MEKSKKLIRKLSEKSQVALYGHNHTGTGSPTKNFYKDGWEECIGRYTTLRKFYKALLQYFSAIEGAELKKKSSISALKTQLEAINLQGLNENTYRHITVELLTNVEIDAAEAKLKLIKEILDDFNEEFIERLRLREERYTKLFKNWIKEDETNNKALYQAEIAYQTCYQGMEKWAPKDKPAKSKKLADLKQIRNNQRINSATEKKAFKGKMDMTYESMVRDFEEIKLFRTAVQKYFERSREEVVNIKAQNKIDDAIEVIFAKSEEFFNEEYNVLNGPKSVKQDNLTLGSQKSIKNSISANKTLGIQKSLPIQPQVNPPNQRPANPGS